MERGRESGPRALVVGTGFGCRIQAPALRGAGFEVVGIVGSDAGRTARRAAENGIAQSFTDLDEAITKTGASVVAVAAPPGSHCAVTLAAIARGCHVLCEKPFAKDLAEASRMLQAAERAGVIHMIGHEFRFVPQRALVARAIAEGLIGEPRFVALVGFTGYVADYAPSIPSWWFDPAAGGGWLGASGSHIVDQIRSELGEFRSVSATLPKVSAAAAAVEDSFTVRFQLSGGVDGVMQQCAGAFGPPVAMFRVAGTKGTLWTEGQAVWIADKSGARELAVPADLALPPDPPPSSDRRQDTAEWRFLSSLELGPYTKLCGVLRAAIEGGPSPSSRPPATFADGVACMRVIDAIRSSAANDGAVTNIAT